MRRLAPILACLALPALAQTDLNESDVTAPILDAALAECRAESDGQGPAPELLIEPGAVTWVALDDPEVKDDLILDFNHVFCSVTFSLWHGTGGSRIHVVLNGETTEAWGGGLWRVTEFLGHPLLLIGRHGSACDGFGAQPCVQAISAFDGQFSTVVFPEPLDPASR